MGMTLAFLRRLPRTKSSQKKRRWLIFPPCIAVNWATSSIVATSLATTINATNAIMTTETNYCHQDDWCHNGPCCNNKDSKNSKSYEKKNDCKQDYFKKKRNNAIHNDQSSLSSAGALSGKRSHSRSRSPPRSCSWFSSHSSSRGYNNHHVSHDDCKPSAAPKCGYSYSFKSNDGGHIHCTEKSNTIFATTLLQQQRKVSAPTNRKLRQQRSCVYHLVVSLFQIEN